MKRTMTVVITDKETFARGELDYALSLYAKPQAIAGWINVCEVEIDFSSVDRAAITKQAVKDIDEKIETAKGAFAAAMTEFERQRNELLSITHTPGDTNE
jgi:hypothetical protein